MRPYQGPGDLVALQNLARGVSDPFGCCPPAGDLPEMLDMAASDTAAHTAVWEDERGTLAGFVFVSQYLNLHFHFRSECFTPQREGELIAFARHHALVLAQGRPDATLDASARDENATAVAFLRRLGFVPGEERTLYMARSLLAPCPEPEFPLGFVLRPLAGASEVRAYVATHRAAYGTENMTAELRMAILRAPYYRPELDLVLVAPGGALVAFCVCNVYDEVDPPPGRREGEIGIVGTHPAYQGRGLGRAMVNAGLIALRDHGLDRARLGVSSSNTRALHIYEAAGFATESSVRWWSLALRGAAGNPPQPAVGP